MRTRALLLIVVVLLAANLGWMLWTGGLALPWHRARTPVSADAGPVAASVVGAPAAPATTALARPEVRVVAAPSPTARDAAPNLPPAPVGLLVPVQGVDADELQDTFDDPRSGERMHEALDIMAPAGTPVLAVADGHVEKLFTSERGGLTIYQFEPGGHWCYYYAHLQSYAPGLVEGATLRRGEVIGYVGSSGNADPAAPHLHFAVFALTPEKQWWRGTAVDPLPLLAGANGGR